MGRSRRKMAIVGQTASSPRPSSCGGCGGEGACSLEPAVTEGLHGLQSGVNRAGLLRERVPSGGLAGEQVSPHGKNSGGKQRAESCLTPGHCAEPGLRGVQSASVLVWVGWGSWYGNCEKHCENSTGFVC